MCLTLSDLDKHDEVIVVELSGGDAYYRQLLLSSGIVPGAKITIKKFAPLGDPLEISINGHEAISIRKSEAAIIKVTF